MSRTTHPSNRRDLPPGAAHRPGYPLPPAPFDLDPEITAVMDGVAAWLVDLLPGLKDAGAIDRHALWEVAWRVREISGAAGSDPLDCEEGCVLAALIWWHEDPELGDDITRFASEVAA